MLYVLRCTILGLHILYKEIDLLHRDISYGNIAFYKKGDKYYVVILDFDLAAFVDREGGATSNHRTGTAPFMARELLNAIFCGLDFVHTINHDLESVYNLMIWRGTGYRSNKYPKEDPLKDWRKGTQDDMLGAKQSFVKDQKRGRADRILACITNKVIRSNLERIRSLYKQKATGPKQQLSIVVIEQRSHDEARKAVEAYLREHPFEDVDDDGPQEISHKVYEDSMTRLKLGSETEENYEPISYKEIIEATSRSVEDRHKGCRCC